MRTSMCGRSFPEMCTPQGLMHMDMPESVYRITSMYCAHSRKLSIINSTYCAVTREDEYRRKCNA